MRGINEAARRRAGGAADCAGRVVSGGAVVSEQVYAYVGIKPCGHANAAAVDRPEFKKENAKHVARMLREGWTVERWPIERVRTDLHFCKCKAEGK